MKAERTRRVAGEDAVRKAWSATADKDSTAATNAAVYLDVSTCALISTRQHNALVTVLPVKVQFEKIEVPLLITIAPPFPAYISECSYHLRKFF
jgi:hypothetical protein